MLRRHFIYGWLLALAFVIAPPAVRSAGARDTAASVMADARDQFARGRYTQSIIQFRELLDQWPGSAEAEDATWYLAESYRLNHDWTLAQVQYEHLLSSFPGSAHQSSRM